MTARDDLDRWIETTALSTAKDQGFPAEVADAAALSTVASAADAAFAAGAARGERAQQDGSVPTGTVREAARRLRQTKTSTGETGPNAA
jgi:hypothetical protein